MSPFQNNVAFVPTTPSITSVTVSPDAVTLSAGGAVQLTATVVTAGFAPKDVKWSVQGEVTDVTVDESGGVRVASDATSETATIRATSVYDSTKYDDCVITIA